MEYVWVIVNMCGKSYILLCEVMFYMIVFYSWKDLLPDVLKVLANHTQLAVDGVLIKGSEFRANTVNSLITMNWPIEIITSIADMFR